MDQLTPIYRIEFFLDAIVNNSPNDLDPIYRVEFFLAKIAGRDVEIPQPLSRMEMYLAQLCGESVTLPQPLSRTEQYLAAICGEDVEIPPYPVYRIEYWLAAWAEGGSEIVTVTGIAPLALLDAVAHPIRSLVQYGLCVQNGTPTPTAPADVVCNNGAIKCSMNMANVNADTALVGYYVSAQGVVTADTNNWIYQEYIPVLPNTSYTLSMSSPAYYVTISEYSTAEDSGFVVRKNGSTGANTSLTITTGETTNFIRFGTNIDRAAVTLERVLGINWMLNIGDTAMDYQPYVEGGIYTDGTAEVLTVSADGAEPQTVTDILMLLSVGDDKDRVEFISGHADRAITVFRVSPDLNWLLASGTGYKQFYAPYTRVPLKSSVSCMSNIAPYGCTASNRTSYQHGCYTGGTGNLCFQMIGEADINTVDDWEDFLRTNGVYVVAVKAAATAEQTTPHALHTSAGTNVVDVTAAVSPVQLSVEYAKGAS